MVEKDQIKQILKFIKYHEEQMSLLFGVFVVIVVIFGLSWYFQILPTMNQNTPRVESPDIMLPPQVSLPPDAMNPPSPESPVSPASTATPLPSPTLIQSSSSPASTPEVRTYVVRAGEGLWQIAERFYGDGNQYVRIYNANRNVMANPEDIRVGMRLRIP